MAVELRADATGPGEAVTSRSSVPWNRIRLAAGLVYIAALTVWSIRDGVPTGRGVLALLVVLALSITVLGRGWRRILQVVTDWLPFTAVLMLYDRSRGIADGIGMPLHLSDIVDLEKALFFGHVPTVWLQEHLYTPGQSHWYDAVMSLVYTSHFLVTPILAAVLWVVNRERWMFYVSRVVVLSFAGLVTYVLFPEAPPWMASEQGLIGPVHRISALGWDWLGAGFAQQALEHGQEAGSNPVAAMPSLHTAIATLAAIMAAQMIGRRWAKLFYLYPVLMGFCLVYTGEHYVVDLIGGVVYALAVHVGVSAFTRWWRRRSEERKRVAAA